MLVIFHLLQVNCNCYELSIIQYTITINISLSKYFRICDTNIILQLQLKQKKIISYYKSAFHVKCLKINIVHMNSYSNCLLRNHMFLTLQFGNTRSKNRIGMLTNHSSRKNKHTRVNLKQKSDFQPESDNTEIYHFHEHFHLRLSQF